MKHPVPTPLPRAECRAAPKTAPASRETRLALRPSPPPPAGVVPPPARPRGGPLRRSTPALAGLEPRPTFPTGDRPRYSVAEGLS